MFIQKIASLTFRYFLAPVVLLCMIAVLSGLLYRAYLQNALAVKTKITTPDGIESLENVTLGDVEQWILIRGTDKSNPVLLVVHGGPGSVMLPYHRSYNTDLEEHFTVVHWDQRGAGKSYDPDIPPDSMSLSQIVEDSRQLSELLIRRFDVPKIYLMGHSWGTMIGTNTVALYPELFYAYIGVGQVVNEAEGEAVSYRFAVNKAAELGNEVAMRELQGIGPPPYSDEESSVRWTWVDNFGGAIHSPDMTVLSLVLQAVTSPDYSIGDWLNYLPAGRFSHEHIISKADYHVNFIEDVPKIEVPVYFLEGRHDYIVPFELAERYFEILDAPAGKQLIWFENSAHVPFYEEPEQFFEIMVNKVLKETYPVVSKTGSSF